VRTCIGTDWVGRHLPARSLSPLEGLMQAVTHGGFGEKERITAREALEAYTVGSSTAENMQDQKGSLTAGKLADLVVLSEDPLAVVPEKLPALQVLMTMVGGQIVHHQTGFAEPSHRAPPSTIGPPPAKRPPTIGPAREPTKQKH
jgi:predicted amidohydrolase YtcJ